MVFKTLLGSAPLVTFLGSALLVTLSSLRVVMNFSKLYWAEGSTPLVTVLGSALLVTLSSFRVVPVMNFSMAISSLSTFLSPPQFQVAAAAVVVAAVVAAVAAVAAAAAVAAVAAAAVAVSLLLAPPAPTFQVFFSAPIHDRTKMLLQYIDIFVTLTPDKKISILQGKW